MKPTLTYLFLTFLRIGATSWGGFMVLISMIQKKVVEKDGNLEANVIMEGISLASVLPGPMAVNVVSFVGYRLGGWTGAFVSVVAVLLPSFLLMLALSHLYFLYGNIPAMSHFFSGILPAVAAIIISVAVNLGEKSIKDLPQIVIAIASAVLIFFSKSYLTTLTILVGSGIFGYIFYYKPAPAQTLPEQGTSEIRASRKQYWLLIPVAALVLLFVFINKSPGIHLHKTILLTFSGMSLSQFGGGYVIIPTMQKIVVDGMKWLSDKEFVDAVAMGQITPGPIFVSATFIGYKLAGFWGALNATISIFFPTAILTVFCAKFFNKISSSALVTAIFKGLRPAIIGMIASAALTILWNNGLSIFTIAIFALALLTIMRFKIDPVYVIPVAGIIGILIL
ncbi:chromate efflux transporter [Dyadobacter pollutisoli]|uniref:Chromate efflux transporter n=1 Tax=Dyadobacter pollutisoli TaxID=2910158 RepID=A0A9E8SPI1_9BACT|nr:chromate efflux transporter [Dyadobacter pollutisoli]WAC15374.1 chromate efflux transporter [Dyadobacter pollutisoli]